MRVNVYAEEMTSRVEIVTKRIGTEIFTGLRLYLELPVTVRSGVAVGGVDDIKQVSGPFLHRDVNGIPDDDSSAVTFWGKRDLREVVTIMRLKLDKHYGTDTGNEFAQQARSWMSCCAQLDLGSPFWSAQGSTGCDSAVLEIKRLQKSDTDLQAAIQEITTLKKRIEQLETGAK